jgi:hypothetical protein
MSTVKASMDVGESTEHAEFVLDVQEEEGTTDRRLLQGIPSHRQISILWKAINAYVPVFSPSISFIDQMRRKFPGNQSSGKPRQVRANSAKFYIDI